MLPQELVERYHADPESVYHTWFLDEGRLKVFRTIRRGIQALVQDLEHGSFHNDYHGSSLEAVVEVIAEQKQVFAGAAHPFYWKPKLRIPDIYENRLNQRRYADFLKTAVGSSDAAAIEAAILKLAVEPIKGVGPASGNLLYFLHPTAFPPFNTAIVRGYNLLTGQNLRLGDWQAYLQMREGLLALVQASQGALSRDLGDVSGLCFEIGTARLISPELPAAAREEMLKQWEKVAAKRHKEIVDEAAQDREHAEQQARLARLGQGWGYRVWIARNDHRRVWSGGRLGDLSLRALPVMPRLGDARETVELIDVLWLSADQDEVVAAFEVEKSTSIYSGILRLYDLALSVPACRNDLYLVAPDDREGEVLFQLSRPSLTVGGTPLPEYILFNDLACNCDQMARFGGGIATLKKLSRRPERTV